MIHELRARAAEHLRVRRWRNHDRLLQDGFERGLTPKPHDRPKDFAERIAYFDDASEAMRRIAESRARHV